MGSAPNPPKPPKFYPIDIPGTLAKALEYDVASFQESDKAQLPGLVKSRDLTISDAYKQLTGPVDPTVLDAYTQSAIEKGLSITGGGNVAAGLQSGTLGRNIAGIEVARAILQKQDYDRNYFQTLIESNPQRAFGLSGSDVARLAIVNTGQLNASNQQQYTSQLAGIAAQGAAGVQTGQAISAVGGLIGKFGSSSTPSDKRLKKSIQYVGISPRGIPVAQFEYIEGIGLPEGLHQGVIAQDLLPIRPDAVEYHSDGYMTVDYSKIDVPHKKL